MFGRKKEIPELFKATIELLADETVQWTCSVHRLEAGAVSIWLQNRPYADMQVNDSNPPRWVAGIMRPLVDRARFRVYTKTVQREAK